MTLTGLVLRVSLYENYHFSKLSRSVIHYTRPAEKSPVLVSHGRHILMRQITTARVFTQIPISYFHINNLSVLPFNIKI